MTCGVRQKSDMLDWMRWSSNSEATDQRNTRVSVYRHLVTGSQSYSLDSVQADAGCSGHPNDGERRKFLQR